jgi:hypothetical protein
MPNDKKRTQSENIPPDEPPEYMKIDIPEPTCVYYSVDQVEEIEKGIL